MKNIMSLLAVLAIIFALIYHAPSKQNDETTNDQQDKSMQSELENHCVKERTLTKWPSFNDSSYIYILGLFLKQHTSMLTTPEERAMFMSAILLSQQYNITVNGRQFAYRVEETSGLDAIDTLDRTCLSISENQILGIVGPSGSNEAKTIAQFCNRVGLPVLGYSTTDPGLSDRNAYQTFYRMSASDIKTAQALLKLFQKYNWNSANIIYQGDNYGQGGLQALTETFSSKVKISCTIKYDLFTDRIENFRHQLETSPSRIVLLWANANVTTKIIELAVKEGNILAPDFLWIMTATNSRMRLNNKQLTGMLLIRPVSPQTFDLPINRTLLKDAIDIWKTYDPQSNNDDEKQIDGYALYAFDSAWMLILALHKLCQQRPNDCPSLLNTSHCFASFLTNRNKLHNIMQTMDFFGVSGHVQFRENTTDRLMQNSSHFIIDNLQPSMSRANINELHAIEVLKLCDSTRDTNYRSINQWIEVKNTIQWPRGLDKVPVHYAKLEGKTLNITVYVSPPFYMEKFDNYSNGTNRTEPEGYIVDLILLLEQRLKFHRNITVAPIKTTYNDLVHCVENRTYDIVMADLTRTTSRLDQIDFSVSIYDNRMRMVIRKSKKMTTPMMAFLKPFHYSLWLGILGIYLVSTFFITLFEFIGGKERAARIDKSASSTTAINPTVADVYHESKRKTLSRSMYHTIGGLLQIGSELQLRTGFGRFQTVVVWLVSVVLITLFTSNMVQYFTAEREKPWIQSIEDLKMCGRIGCSRIGIIEHSQHADYFKKEVTNDIEMNYYHLKHPQESFRKLLDHHIDVAIADSSSADYLTQTDFCDLEVAGLPFGRTEFGIAIPKNWTYKDELDRTLMNLKEGPAIDNLLTKWFQQKNCDHENEAKFNAFGNGLTLDETRGLFIIFGVLTGINFLFFIPQLVGAIRRQFRAIDTRLVDLSGNNPSAQQKRDEPLQSITVGATEESHEGEENPKTRL